MSDNDPSESERQYIIDQALFSKWINHLCWALATAFIVGMAYEFSAPFTELLQHTGRAFRALFGW